MVAFLLSAVVSSALTPVSDSSAQTITVENTATGYYVSVTSPDTVELEVDATPVGQTVVSSTNTINVKTNAPLGYKLYLSTENDELTSTDSSITQTFKPVTSTSLSVNTWGFSTDSTATKNWLAVPEVTSGNESSGYLLSSSATPNIPDGDNINVYYGINSDTTMPSGTYTTTVTYTAIGDGIPEEHTMQEFTMAECINMPVDQTFYLIDSRNNKIYSIIHAKDGNCWMTQNLWLYNSDTTKSLTISSLDSDFGSATTETTFTIPASSDWNTNVTTEAKLHVATNTDYKGEPYYNWVTATAGSTASSGTVNQSICPRGWRLPINGNQYQDKSWTKLLNSYGVTTGQQLLDSSNQAHVLGIHKYYGAWDWDIVSENYQGVYGHFWSSVALDIYAYLLYYNSTTITPMGYSYKGRGFSVRCVLSTTMQEFSATDCANMATDATKYLMDYRNDKAYNIVKARDGNCWMADNLAIYNQTISSADSDLPSGTTITLPASSDWGADAINVQKIHVSDGSGAVSGEVFYNWCAATGLNGSNCSTITNQYQYSICPRGWQLPNGGDIYSDKSFAKLWDTYNITISSQFFDLSSPAYSLGFHAYWDIIPCKVASWGK